MQRLPQANCSLSTTPPTPIVPSAPSDRAPTDSYGPLILTPPTSPTQSRSSQDHARFDVSSEFCSSTIPPKASCSASDVLNVDISHHSNTVDGCLICPFGVEILRSRSGRNEVFGSGAWSIVYKATRPAENSTLGHVTPPPSPIAAKPFLLAVKTPARQDARAILKHEARILSHLSTTPEPEKFIVPFFGFIRESSSLILGAISLSLEEHVLACAATAKKTLSIWNMSEPVIGGNQVWLALAHKMISALTWLHDEAGVVHGDIKPGNYLLKPLSVSQAATEFPFQPVLIDFTSSHLLNDGKSNPNALSAVTREYTAPELLSSAVLRDPKSTATCASDVFSTAVTLLAAATGDTRVYPGSVFQRQAMATQGWQVLQLVRSGEQGSRVPRHGVVERTLERAVLKADFGRVSAQRWLDIVEEIIRGEPSKMS